ncbi:MAG: DNA polymerase III subunit beta [Oscillospiraceae bacterium]|jgi:DNA polymerase-3 subunit beta
MNFKVSKSELKTALSAVGKAVAAKATLPQLENVLFALMNGALSLTAYDLEIGITTTIAAESMDTGSFLAKPDMIEKFISKMKKDELEIICDGKALTLINGKSEVTLPCMAVDDFPTIPQTDGGIEIKMEQSVLKSMISETIFAVGVNSTKPQLNGELFEIKNNIFNVVACDGYRMAIRTEKVNAPDVSVIIPAKALSEAVKLLSNGECSLLISDKHTLFKIGDFNIFTRNIDGEYHNYKQSIPKSSEIEYTAHRGALLDSLERCLLMINSRVKSPVRCLFGDDTIKLNISTDLGRLSDEVEADGTGKLEIGVNAMYMSAPLRAIAVDTVKILMSGAHKPILIKPVEGDSFTMLVLPVRLKND